jgi:hypothetical protein
MYSAVPLNTRTGGPWPYQERSKLCHGPTRSGHHIIRSDVSEVVGKRWTLICMHGVQRRDWQIAGLPTGRE